MKPRIIFLLIFLCLFLLTPVGFSGTWTDIHSNGTFSFTGTTISTSSKLTGYGSESWHVTGNASISGTAIELGQDTVYDCELWLYASGDIDSSPFPEKKDIDTSRVENGVNQDVFTKGDASISYLSHPVGSIAPDEVNFYDSQVARELSRSLSESYANSSAGPTDLCASPAVHGNLSGVLLNHVGSKSVVPLSLASKTNKACADNLDDGGQVVAVENCYRKQLCQFPGTATKVEGSSYGSHYVKCPEYIEVLAGEFFKLKRYEKQPCPSSWWTCDDDPEKPWTLNVCLHVNKHINPEEWSSFQWRYVDPSTGESVSTANCLGGCGDVIPATAQSSYHLVKDCEGCREDYYSCKQGAAHGIVHNLYAPENLKCGHLYRLCASGDYGLKQVSCATDPDCIATDFWLCQHTTHQYANDLPPGTEAPTVPTTVTCRNFHTYSTTDASAVAYHAEVKTCTRCGVSYVECDASDSAKSGCSAGYVWHTTEAQSPDPPPSIDPPPSTDPPSTDPPAEDKEDCGVHLTGTSGSHAWVSQCTSSSNNTTCTNTTGYYACDPHTHQYPSGSNQVTYEDLCVPVAYAHVSLVGE